MTVRKQEHEQDAALFKDLAGQHKQMRQSFPAYQIMLDEIDRRIAEQDAGWENFDKDKIDVHRGRKAALVDFKRYLFSFLNAEIREA